MISSIISFLYISGPAGERAFVGILTGLAVTLLFALYSWISRKRENVKRRKEHEEKKRDYFISSNIEDYYQSLVTELRNLCEPINFMQPYDYKKVKVANELYSLLKKENLSREEIITIRQRAKDELGVSLSTKTLFSLLKEACNPSRFMNPYDQERVSKANELYNEIITHENSIPDLERIGSIARAEGFITGNNEITETYSLEIKSKDEETIHNGLGYVGKDLSNNSSLKTQSEEESIDITNHNDKNQYGAYIAIASTLIVIIVFVLLAVLTHYNNNQGLNYEKTDNKISSNYSNKTSSNTTNSNEPKALSITSLSNPNYDNKLIPSGWENYTNVSYSIGYPSSWEVKNNKNQIILIKKRTYNNNDFMPSINIIESAQKRTESTIYLAKGAYNQVKEEGIATGSVEYESVNLGGLSGTCWNTAISIDGYSLFEKQYIVKNKDNTVFIISTMVDEPNKATHSAVIESILSTLIFDPYQYQNAATEEELTRLLNNKNATESTKDLKMRKEKSRGYNLGWKYGYEDGKNAYGYGASYDDSWEGEYKVGYEDGYLEGEKERKRGK